ncbi:MAG: flagellar hook-associated protein FlgK [Methylococcaceae bacterium]|nr:flagellar hook-associated protein FlgK [Methylococcaceae bacterium]
MSSIIGTALSGLMAAQRSLETASHNIANVNTEGYSRQRTEYATRQSDYTGVGFIGNGVNVTTVARSYDRFITSQLNTSTSAFSETNGFYKMASQVDNLIANQATGLSPTLKAFFSAVNEVANDPASIPARQVMLSKAESLTGQFSSLSTQFDALRQQTNNQMQSMTDDINSYAKNIAELNGKIIIESGLSSTERLPNDLLDQRDALVAKIAEKISVSTVAQADGSLSVFVGSGQSLVLGLNASRMSIGSSTTDVAQKTVLINGQNITSQVTGGELAGALKFRDEVLDPAQNQLGLIAAGFATEFNALQTSGRDLNGNVGTALFNFGAPAIPVFANQAGPGTLTANYSAPSTNLAASDYLLSYDGTNYQLKQLSDNTTTTYAGSPITGPGFTLTPSGLNAGDSFLVRPTSEAAKKLTVAITDPRQIAAASNPTAGPGDNTNALKMAKLESKAALLGGKSSFSEVYGQLVAKVGDLTHSASVSSAAQEVVLNQARSSRENLAGVNLDEEAANLIKFQNAYQASAQSISITKSLFDTLLGAVR